MAPRQRPTAEQAAEAVRLLLDGMEIGSDIVDALDQIRPMHPRNNAFPGEVFRRLAARAASNP